MRANWSWKLTVTIAVAAIAAVGALSMNARAEPPYADYALSATSTKVNYVVPPGLSPVVTAQEAAETARSFTASQSARTKSVLLGLYSDLADRDVLVWVVDLDGLSMPALGGPVGRATQQNQPARTITRAVVFVSASQPNHVVSALSVAPR